MTRALKIFSASTRALTYTAMLLMALVTFVDVGGRVFFGRPLGFAYEIIGVFLGVAVYAGLISSCFARDHIRVDLMDLVWERLGKLDRVRDVIVWLMEGAFFVMLAAFMVRQTLTSQRYGEVFLFLPLEKWIPLAIASGFAALAALAHLLSFSPAARALQSPQDGVE